MASSNGGTLVVTSLRVRFVLVMCRLGKSNMMHDQQRLQGHHIFFSSRDFFLFKGRKDAPA
jgi:hypothetical protein